MQMILPRFLYSWASIFANVRIQSPMTKKWRAPAAPQKLRHPPPRLSRLLSPAGSHHPSPSPVHVGNFDSDRNSKFENEIRIRFLSVQSQLGRSSVSNLILSWKFFKRSPHSAAFYSHTILTDCTAAAALGHKTNLHTKRNSLRKRRRTWRKNRLDTGQKLAMSLGTFLKLKSNVMIYDTDNSFIRLRACMVWAWTSA